MTPVIVLTTVGATQDVDSIATLLVEKRLAACVNIIPRIYSVYRWKDSLERESEQMLLIKTTDERLTEVREALFAVHPYEVPEFVVVRIDDLSDAYRSWLVDQVQRGEK
ncbi:MAG TPA: divalent-cation tolerance protein CutA [Thermoanaerobaculia bacterium]|nr:divalent-cation tolerance protein CutA [Thermoanaerobaculia bacterium]